MGAAVGATVVGATVVDEVVDCVEVVVVDEVVLVVVVLVDVVVDSTTVDGALVDTLGGTSATGVPREHPATSNAAAANRNPHSTRPVTHHPIVTRAARPQPGFRAPRLRWSSDDALSEHG